MLCLWPCGRLWSVCECEVVVVSYVDAMVAVSDCDVCTVVCVSAERV